ncbi:oligosaccharide flippase family protein [Actinomycetospora aeridis]|uniref:Oligosaccharide flippase family protein n=1 Tax=Actinomycetospora aeridis TaxID=3129231 RepID=A0ABU8N8I7_9PSEU
MTSGAVGPLGATLRKGAVLSAAALVLVQVLSFVQTVLLARLLSPTEIGLYAAGTVIAGFLANFSEGGLGGAVVQREGELDRAAETAFWANVITGVLMASAVVAASGFIGEFFRSDVVGLIAAISAGTLFLHALTHVPDALMQRRFNFKRRLILDPGTVLTFATVSVTLAALGYGVWSMVIASYASQFVWVACSFGLSGWRPGRHRPSYRIWRELARFAFPLVLEAVGERTREVAETALVGRSMNEAALGNYRYGQRLSKLPGLAIVQVGSYVLFPAFSRIAGDTDRLRIAFLRALRWIWLAAVPVAVLAVALGIPAVVLLLGEEWRGAGVALVAMSGYGVGVALQAVAGETLKGIGRTQLLNWVTGVDLVFGIGLLVLLLPLGLVGVGLAITVAALAGGTVTLVLAVRAIAMPWGAVLGVLWPPVVAAVIPGVLLWLLEHSVVHADLDGALGGILELVAEVGLFSVLYLVGIRVLAPSSFSVISSTALRLLRRVRRAS